MYDIEIIRKEGGSTEPMKMIIIEPSSEKQEIVSEKVPGRLYIRREFQCIDKFSVVSAAGELYMLKAGDKLIFSARQDEELEVSCMGEGRLALLCTYYNEEAERPVQQRSNAQVQVRGSAEVQPPGNAEMPASCIEIFDMPEDGGEAAVCEKSLASDLKLAYKIALTRFRGSTLIVRSLRGVWFDRALQRGIDRIESTYLPYILTIIGLMVIGLTGAGKIENSILFMLMGAWIVFVLIIVVPLIFYSVLPKPIACHIKRTDSLSEEERKLYEEELSRNKRVNKIIKRYTMVDRRKER